jgi:hypothetical protein
MKKYTRLILGVIVSVIIIAGLGQFLYIDSCLDLGGIIMDGICYNEYSEELQYALSAPVIYVAVIIFVGVTGGFSLLLGKVFRRLK